MRIVQLVNTTEYGGVEEHVRQLGAGLVRRGDQVTIVCPPTQAANHFAGTAAAQGLDVRRTPLGAGDGPFGTWLSLSRLHGVLQAVQPDVLHIHLTGYTGGRLAVLAGQWARVGAIVCTSHLAPREPAPRRLRFGRQLLNHRVHRFLAVSENSLRNQVRYLGQPPSRSAVVHNGVELTRFPEEPDRIHARQELGLPLNVPIVGTVGRLAPQKSFETLIESLPAILAARPDVHVLVVGDGPDRNRLVDLAQRLGVADRLHLAGFRTDIPLCLSAMDLFVLTSIFEGLPISILEAMASGLSVVATDVDGVPEAVIDGVTGKLIAPGSPHLLAEKVLGLLSDPAMAAAMGAAGREQIRVRFTIDHFVTSVRGEYEVALGARRRQIGPCESRVSPSP